MAAAKSLAFNATAIVNEAAASKAFVMMTVSKSESKSAAALLRFCSVAKTIGWVNSSRDHSPKDLQFTGL
jgi:hypothetical protein